MTSLRLDPFDSERSDSVSQKLQKRKNAIHYFVQASDELHDVRYEYLSVFSECQCDVHIVDKHSFDPTSPKMDDIRHLREFLPVFL